MHCSVIDVGGYGLDSNAVFVLFRIAKGFLLVADVVYGKLVFSLSTKGPPMLPSHVRLAQA